MAREVERQVTEEQVIALAVVEVQVPQVQRLALVVRLQSA